MTSKIFKKNILAILVLVSIISVPFYSEIKSAEENPGPFFSISILCPNTNPARNQ